ncbi:MAG TPA: hypothetical protein DCZ92_09125 [Elusimicrobia bacterium]|nr:MAG: hypothetical protein A2016_07975 [Elusimicrobia bacterium GWF2_62_30]HBA60964.1 hypothetical protein [Elusimicrobiota bacterium]
MLFKVFIRSFFIQAGWNYERFQSLGFAFSLMPALRKIYPDPERLKAAVLRHLDIFNTQPYMASFILGNIARMEERASASADPAAELKSMPGVKQALASSFASIGDRVFWGRLKPMTVQLCLLVWTLGGFYGWLFTGQPGRPSTALLLAGPLSGIVLYSAAAVYCRWRGLARGYACGGASSCGLDFIDWGKLIKRLSAAGFGMSMAIALFAFGLLAASGSCPGRVVLLKVAVAASVLALHRVTRAYGRSVFFAAGIVFAVSLVLFSVFELRPLTLYL